MLEEESVYNVLGQMLYIQIYSPGISVYHKHGKL